MNDQRTPDISAATPELIRVITDAFRAKSQADVDGFMDFFSREKVVYIDPTLRLMLAGWTESRGALTQLMSSWTGTAESYATKIVGDENSAIVFMVDSAEMFGAEIRTVSPVDFENGKITRQVDYWSGLDWPQDHLAQVRFPADQFSSDFKELSVGERATPVIRQTANALSVALAGDDATSATALLAPDAEFDDLGLNLHLVGPQAIHSFLKRALRLLPYGSGATVRHVVGSDAGGGYEWTAGVDTGHPGLPGVTALELDGNGKIFRITSAWDASAISRKARLTMYEQTIPE
jgi:hypothetical protein